MKFLRSIRWRLQFWYGLFLLFLLGGFGFTAYQMEHSRQLRRIDDELRKRVEALNQSRRQAQNPSSPGSGKGPPHKAPPPPPRKASDPETPRERPPPPTRLAGNLQSPGREAARYDGSDGFYFVIWLRNGPELTPPPGAPADVPKPATAEGAFRLRGDFREYYMVPAPDDYVLVGRSIASELAELRRFGWLLAGAGAGVLALGLLGGWWLVSRALQPIHAISDTAAKIADGDLSQRIEITTRESELDELAAVLNSTFTRLDAAFAQQTRFTADAAHELRTPVTVMLTHAQAALETACPADDHHEAFEACQRAAQRMRRLIESLLQLARFDAGHEPLHRQRVDLAELARETADLLQPIAAERRITLQLDLASAPLEGDPDRLGQVITNLLGNAIHYNHLGGEVRVTTAVHDSRATLTVADNGPGIAPRHLPHIFERFYRADQARTSTEGRTGLGLAICRAIVDAHGGRLTAASEPGAGAVFRVELPVGPPPRSA